MPDENNTKSQTRLIISRPPFLGGGEWSIGEIRRINVVMGRNGSGKSLLLRGIETRWISQDSVDGFPFIARYIPPERGGPLQREPSFEESLRDAAWYRGQNLKNQAPQFRQMAASQWRRLKEVIVYRGRDDRSKDPLDTIDETVKLLNELLPKIKIEDTEGRGLAFASSSTGQSLDAVALSSGEAEAITLALEATVFGLESSNSPSHRLLLLDEPDVHIHPDLQVRLIAFLCKVAERYDFRIIIATHSTAILAELAKREDAGVHWLNEGSIIEFDRIRPVHERLAVVLDSYPLGSVLQRSPILLLEGEDDERVWHKARASSRERLKFVPVCCSGKDQLRTAEKVLDSMLSALLDIPNPNASFSLRDLDNASPENPLSPLSTVTRLRLACRDIENCLLSDEVLEQFGLTWDDLRTKVRSWLAQHSSEHPAHNALDTLMQNGADRRSVDIKSAADVLATLLSISSPTWQEAVGSAIGRAVEANSLQNSGENCLWTYLSAEVVSKLLSSSQT